MIDATYSALLVVTVRNDEGEEYVLRVEEQRSGWLEDLIKGRIMGEQIVGAPYWAVYRFPYHGPSMWVCDCGVRQDVAEFIAKAMPLHDWKGAK